MEAQFSISWDAQKSFLSGLMGLQQKGDYVDMTLAADDGHFVRVHQVVLALCSPYLSDLIKSAQVRNTGHPILFLNGISYKTLSSLLEYMYTGEVSISIGNLVEFIEAGKKLLIRGIERLENPLLTIQKRAETQNGNSEEYNIIQVGNQSEEEPEVNSGDQEPRSVTSVPAPVMEVDKIIEPVTAIEPESILPDKKTSSPTPVRILPKPNPTPAPKLKGKLDDMSGSIQGKLQYTISNKGSLQMIFNRFMYYEKYTKKSRLRQWRCVDYLTSNLKCPAYVVTKEENILQRVQAHNHPFHDQKILKKLRAGSVYTTINQVEIENKAREQD